MKNSDPVIISGRFFIISLREQWVTMYLKPSNTFKHYN